MAKYKVKCYETATYEFEIDANDEDDAWFKAHDVLLGCDDWEGALRMVQPDGTHIECDVTDREWDIQEEQA